MPLADTDTWLDEQAQSQMPPSRGGSRAPTPPVNNITSWVAADVSGSLGFESRSVRPMPLAARGPVGSVNDVTDWIVVMMEAADVPGAMAFESRATRPGRERFSTRRVPPVFKPGREYPQDEDVDDLMTWRSTASKPPRSEPPRRLGTISMDAMPIATEDVIFGADFVQRSVRRMPAAPVGMPTQVVLMPVDPAAPPLLPPSADHSHGRPIVRTRAKADAVVGLELTALFDAALLVPAASSAESVRSRNVVRMRTRGEIVDVPLTWSFDATFQMPPRAEAVGSVKRPARGGKATVAMPHVDPVIEPANVQLEAAGYFRVRQPVRVPTRPEGVAPLLSFQTEYGDTPFGSVVSGRPTAGVRGRTVVDSGAAFVLISEYGLILPDSEEAVRPTRRIVGGRAVNHDGAEHVVTTEFPFHVAATAAQNTTPQRRQGPGSVAGGVESDGGPAWFLIGDSTWSADTTRPMRPTTSQGRQAASHVLDATARDDGLTAQGGSFGPRTQVHTVGLGVQSNPSWSTTGIFAVLGPYYAAAGQVWAAGAVAGQVVGE